MGGETVGRQQEKILDGLANLLGMKSITEVINKTRDGDAYMTANVCRNPTWWWWKLPCRRPCHLFRWVSEKGTTWWIGVHILNQRADHCWKVTLSPRQHLHENVNRSGNCSNWMAWYKWLLLFINTFFSDSFSKFSYHFPALPALLWLSRHCHVSRVSLLSDGERLIPR
jgi:hypothetical protein